LAIKDCFNDIDSVPSFKRKVKLDNQTEICFTGETGNMYFFSFAFLFCFQSIIILKTQFFMSGKRDNNSVRKSQAIRQTLFVTKAMQQQPGGGAPKNPSYPRGLGERDTIML
jgi:hypothetical protein